MNFKEETKMHLKNADKLEQLYLEDIKQYILENDIPVKIIDGAIYGSRSRGTEKENSDLDPVVEYAGNVKEYALFNILHDLHLSYEGHEVDINPIRKEESGSLAAYLSNAEAYMKGKTKDSMNNEALKQANLLANWLDSNDKHISDMTITMALKDKNEESIVTVMSDGSIKKVDSNTNEAKAFSSAVDAIKSMSNDNANAKDSFPNQATFSIELDYHDFAKHFDDKITIENAQEYFDDMIVKKIANGIIYLAYEGSLFENADTVAHDILAKYDTMPIAIKKEGK